MCARLCLCPVVCARVRVERNYSMREKGQKGVRWGEEDRWTGSERVMKMVTECGIAKA